MRKEFPWWLSRLWTQLVSTRMQVRSLASFSRLRIWSGVAVSCGVGRRWSSDPALCGYGIDQQLQLPSLGTSMCCGCGPKKQKKIHIYMYIYTHQSSTHNSIVKGTKQGHCTWLHGSLLNYSMGVYPLHSTPQLHFLLHLFPLRSWKPRGFPGLDLFGSYLLPSPWVLRASWGQICFVYS